MYRLYIGYDYKAGSQFSWGGQLITLESNYNQNLSWDRLA